MEDSLKALVDWLIQFVAVLQNPFLCVFFVSLLVGWVLKNLAEPFPNWLIPAVLAALGLLAGAVLLGTGAQGRFQGSLVGLTLALASTGFHQVWSQIVDRFNKPQPGNIPCDKPSSP